MIQRSEIFELIDVERKRQEQWFAKFDDKNTIGKWIIYIERYLQRAKDALFSDAPNLGDFLNTLPHENERRKYYFHFPDELHRAHDVLAARNLKQIAAICVAALENYKGNIEDLE